MNTEKEGICAYADVSDDEEAYADDEEEENIIEYDYKRSNSLVSQQVEQLERKAHGQVGGPTSLPLPPKSLFLPFGSSKSFSGIIDSINTVNRSSFKYNSFLKTRFYTLNYRYSIRNNSNLSNDSIIEENDVESQ